MTHIKICGITREADALAAAEAGADALGFVLAASPRRVSAEAARRIIRRLPPFVSSVGVFVDSTADEVAGLIKYLGLDFVQFHGQETPEFCARFASRAIKALRMDKKVDMEQVHAYEKVTRALLLDSGSGGTGQTFDWKALPQGLERTRLILAGGLKAENIIKAIELTGPWAVDVSSGVEAEPGRKDKQKMIDFISKVQEADHGKS
ncbi:MAG: phosphoribosylanthranilate isomerase [Deltaproteobacteria bacterium]|nr:phosphoribosylanthranilate isomerase [Deltaproteobacteria bacterium]MBW2085400.1 phosphoribosylanthranilate isomerase [Deltaproteobacteria bacterium]